MQRILTAIVLIAAIVLLLFKGELWEIFLASGAAALLALYEYLKLANISGSQIPAWLLLPAATLLFWITFQRPDQQMPLFSALGLVLLGWAMLQSPQERVLRDAAFGLFGLLWVAYPLTLLPLLWSRSDGPALLLFLFIVVWSGDIFALYIGRNFGKHKLAPTLSPNKTWEGAIASLLGSLLCGMSLVIAGGMLSRRGELFLGFADPLWQWVLLAILINIAAQFGDLAESAVKRGAHVKDSGGLLPGHGGMLDRIDALLFAAPALWYGQILLDYFLPRHF